MACAGFDECHPSWIPDRSAPAADMAVDCIDLGFALAALWWISRRQPALSEVGAR